MQIKREILFSFSKNVKPKMSEQKKKKNGKKEIGAII